MGCGASKYAPPYVSERLISTTTNLAASATDSHARLGATDKDKAAGDPSSNFLVTRRPGVGYNHGSYVDYRGCRVKMANATTLKVNFVCVWADNVLDFSARNGGFPSTSLHSNSPARTDGSSERRDLDSVAQMSSVSRFETSCCIPYRPNPSVCNHGASIRGMMEKSYSSRLISPEQSFGSTRQFFRLANKSKMYNTKFFENSVEFKDVEETNSKEGVLVGAKASFSTQQTIE